MNRALAFCSLALILGCSSNSGGGPANSNAAAQAGAAGTVEAGTPGGGASGGRSGGVAAAGTAASTAGASNGAGASSSGGASSGAGASGSGGASSSAGASSGAGASSSAGASSGAGASSSAGASGGPSLPGWTLTWSDEFDGPDGSAVDSTKWVHDIGGSGWGNQELEYYTDGSQNASLQGGMLVITATTDGAAAHTCSYPSNGPCQYTSARLKTQGKFSQQYGRFEARLQMPKGDGIWPAFWALGADISTVDWPTCGEMDIMENIGREPALNHGSLHMPAVGNTNDDPLSDYFTLQGGAALGDDFHVYAVEWSAAAIKFYVDDTLYETQTPSTATGRTWEFDKPFFIILNVAVGGSWPGSPSASTIFPQTMKVDWVRVYSPAQ